MRVLVTGGAGFIGSHTCDRLATAGHEVCAVDDLSTGKLENLAAFIDRSAGRFEQLDIVSPEFAALVTDFRPEVVVHLAAQMDVRKSVADPLADARVNVLGTVRLLTAASEAGTRRVVFASSGGTVYGEPESVPVHESAPLRPLSPYGAAKVSGEVYVAAFAGLYGFEYATLALGNVYGPRQDPHGEAGVVAIFARALLRGAETRIFGDGSAVRDYVYVDDVVDALVATVDGRGVGGRYNVGTARGTSVRELHAAIAQVIGAPDQPVYAPPRTGELDRVVLDVRAAAEQLGWVPQTSLQQGLERTVDWVRSTEA